MSRGKTLTSLLIDYRAKARLSLNPAHNAQVHDSQVKALQAVQEWLWEDFSWPHLRVERYIELEAGQHIYSPPSDIGIDRIEKIEVRFNNRWVKLDAGVDATQYAIYDTFTGQRAWPVKRWKIQEDETIEVWPIPDTDYDATTKEGVLKVTGIRNLSPLVAPDDRADLDNRLIVGYAVADALAAAGAKDANAKLAQANTLYTQIRGNLTPRQPFKMFGTGAKDRSRILRGPPTIYYRPADGS